MELHQLRYFTAIAESENFTEAARRCSISQPSLSQQIIKLERELNQKLFHRLGRRAVLTEAGQFFLERARRILFEVENTTKELKDDPKVGRRIVVGTSPTVAPYLLPPLLERAKMQYPHLEVSTYEDFRGHLIDGVIDGELDLAIASLPIKDPRLSIDPIFTEALMLVVGRYHPFATKAEITIKDLEPENFILLGEHNSLTMQIQRFCGDHDFEPRIGHRCAQLATVKALVSLGLGISILPQVTRSPADKPGLLYKKLSGREPTRDIAIIRHWQRYQSKGAEQFIALLKEFARQREV